MSRSHPRQWEINARPQRPDPAVVADFATFPSTQIADSGGPVSVVARASFG
jgi:4-hydroxy-4-methyl-2-oxoglutarate aldolase